MSHPRAFSFDDRADNQLVEICEMTGVGNKSLIVRAALAHYHETEAKRLQEKRVMAAIHNLADRLRGAA